MNELEKESCLHQLESATTADTEFIDITDRVQDCVVASGISSGLANVQSLHTTTAVVVNEDEPLLLADFRTILEDAAPSDRSYTHDDVRLRRSKPPTDERANGHAHCRALLLGSSVCLNVSNGQLVLGRWQRVFFVELDGPRNRVVSVVALGVGL